MYQIYNNKLTISTSDWILSGLSANCLRKDSANGLLTIIRRGINGNTLIDLASIKRPERRMKIEATFGEPPKIENMQLVELERYITDNKKASAFFFEFRLSDGRHLSNEKQIEYYNNVIVFEAALKRYEHLKSSRKPLGTKRGNIWLIVLDEIQSLKMLKNSDCSPKYPHNLPASEKQLKRIIAKYKENSYAAFIKSYDGQNARKIKDTVSLSILKKMIKHPNNLDNAQIATAYNSFIAKTSEYKPITASTVANYKKRYDLEAYAGRRGANAIYNNKCMQELRDRPTCPLYYATLDGWTAELLYQDVVKDKNGNKTTYHNRLTVLVVLIPSTIIRSATL